MTEKKPSKEILDSSYNFDRLHGHQEKYNPKEPRPKKLKISLYDQYQALCRSELYRSDFKKYLEKRGKEKDLAVMVPPTFSSKLCNAGKWLCNKWKLGYPINPDIPYDKNSKNTLLLIDPPITFLTPPEKWQEMNAIGFEDNVDKFTHIDGKLVLMINTSYSYNELEKTFKEFLKEWVKPSKKRMRSDIVKWQIYDEYIKGKSLLEITHNIFKTEGSPNYNEIVDAYYQQVKRAQKKAHSIIQYLEKQTESHSTK